MHFRVLGLPAASFLPLYGLPDDALAARGVERRRVHAHPGFPDRVALRDAEAGEQVLLLNFEHQPADSPYRSRHAIFVVEGECDTYDAIDTVPDVLRRRMLSLRAFDEQGMIVDASLVDGREAEGEIGKLLALPCTAYLHAHYAKFGCYAARIERAEPAPA
jgi:hypothetical protein